MIKTSMLVKVASGLRRRAKQTQPAFSTRQIIEASFPCVTVTGGSLPEHVDEMLSIRSDGPIIVYKRSLPGPAQRFAIAHAIAHLLFDSPMNSARPGFRGCEQAEQQADLFAAELLAPLELLSALVTLWPSADPDEHELYLDQVDELATHFVIPAAVIDSQIHRLTYLSPSTD